LAVEALKKSLSIKEDNVDVLIGLGTVNSDMENFPEAMTYFKKAIHFKPNLVLAHNSLGNVYLSVGDYTSAAKEFQWILNKNPDSKEAKRMLNYSIKSQERMEKERMGN
jgi:tetratricopeptide (TPR) repeat protein